MTYKVPEGWGSYTVEELINLGYLEPPMDGNHGSIHPTTKDYVSSGIPFIMANDLSNGSINYNNCKYISEKTARKLKKGFSVNGDVLLTHKATMGRTAIVDDKYEYIVLTPQVTYYRVKKDINNKYLKYYFDSNYFQNTLKNWASSGSSRAYLGILAQKKLPIILPPLQEQKAIANILSAIDDKIELNNKINQNLEAQAQAIFKSWFIDFEPFQDGEFVESELGMIPKGWEIKKLHDIVIENRRGISPKYNDNDVGIPVINQRCIRNYQVIEEEIKYHDNSVLEARDMYYLKPYDILINSMGVGTLGRVAQISNPAKEMLVHSCITILRADIKVVTSTYLGYAVKSKQSIIEQMGSGSTGQTSLKKSDLENLNFIIAPIEIQKKVDGLFENILIEKDILHKQNQKLSQLRDTLLPKLISGEIRIPLDK